MYTFLEALKPFLRVISFEKNVTAKNNNSAASEVVFVEQKCQSQ